MQSVTTSFGVSNYYRATVTPYTAYAPLQGQHTARIAIIGAGYAGLNSALSLVERGVKGIVVLEAEQIGHGASGRNGGFVFAGYSLGEQALINQLGIVAARDLYTRSVVAVNTIRQRIARYRIPCSVVDAGVIWANWFRDENVLRNRQRLLAENFGVEWQWIARERLRELVHSERYSGGLFESNALHMHPLNYAIGLAAAVVEQGARMYEHTPALKINRSGAGWNIVTPQGAIEAQQVVLACGGYLAGLDACIDRAVLPIATYVMATEPLGDRLAQLFGTRAAVYDTRFAFDYYRPLPDTRLLWGGRIAVGERSPASVARLLKRDMLRVFPQLEDVRIGYAWSGLMSYARHQMPQLGRRADGLWYAQAFGGHGLAPTTVAGDLLAAAIAEGDESWRTFSQFGLVNTYKPIGYLAAQASYWWYQICDALKR